MSKEKKRDSFPFAIVRPILNWKYIAAANKGRKRWIGWKKVTTCTGILFRLQLFARSLPAVLITASQWTEIYYFCSGRIEIPEKSFHLLCLCSLLLVDFSAFGFELVRLPRLRVRNFPFESIAKFHPFCKLHVQRTIDFSCFCAGKLFLFLLYFFFLLKSLLEEENSRLEMDPEALSTIPNLMNNCVRITAHRKLPVLLQ